MAVTKAEILQALGIDDTTASVTFAIGGQLADAGLDATTAGAWAANLGLAQGLTGLDGLVALLETAESELKIAVDAARQTVTAQREIVTATRAGIGTTETPDTAKAKAQAAGAVAAQAMQAYAAAVVAVAERLAALQG